MTEPSMRMNSIIDNIPTHLFRLTDAEVEALYDYFLKRAGYISYEFDPFILVLIKRLTKHIENL